jgi:drug/metabolite transporter (DMT)-like permease
MFFGSVGDALLSRGMKDVGSISLSNVGAVVSSVMNPWVALGILFLLGFFAAYTTALSWADLTYVLPATSIGYVVLTVIAKFLLHEQVSVTRWLGILLISAGVGFVTRGPALTPAPEATVDVPETESQVVER